MRSVRPKEVSSEKALSLAKAELDRVLAQKAKLNQAVKRFSPTQSFAVSVEPHSDLEPETDNMSQDGAPGHDDAPGAGMEHNSPEGEPQVRHDVSDGKRRCGSALPATTDLAERPLATPSVELFERGITSYSSVEMTRLKGIVDLRIEALNDEANKAAHWNQVQEEDDEHEALRLTPLG